MTKSLDQKAVDAAMDKFYQDITPFLGDHPQHVSILVASNTERGDEEGREMLVGSYFNAGDPTPQNECLAYMCKDMVDQIGKTIMKYFDKPEDMVALMMIPDKIKDDLMKMFLLHILEKAQAAGVEVDSDKAKELSELDPELAALLGFNE